MSHITSDVRACLEACQSCHEVCLETLTHCLARGGEHAEASHIRALLDCAQICATSADFMLRGSPRHGSVCDVCADACTECAASCGKLDGAEMQRCAEECRECAAQCRVMAKVHA
jgi:hypothetical protein